MSQPAKMQSPSADGAPKVAHFAYIDLLRALAILGVVAVHSHQVVDGLGPVVSAFANYGQLGVQLFFVASAITLCLSASQRRGDRLHHFYLRRFFRIAPLFYFGIVFYFGWRWLKASWGMESVIDKYSVITVLENVVFVNGLLPDDSRYIVPGGWSISVEMTFYLVFPLLFILLGRFGPVRFLRWSVVAILAGWAAQAVLFKFAIPALTASDAANDGFGIIYTSIFNQFGVFLIGMLAFTWLGTSISRAHLALAAVLVGLSIWLQNDSTMDSGIDGAIYPILSATAFAIFAVWLSNRPQVHFPGSALLLQIGRKSYSIYLMHFFMVDVVRLALANSGLAATPNLLLLATFLLTSAITLGLATITETLIEKPFIRRGSALIAKLKARQQLAAPAPKDAPSQA